MTQEQLKELESQEDAAWQRLKAAEASIEPIKQEWLNLRHTIEKEKVKNALRAELLAEQSGTKEGA